MKPIKIIELLANQAIKEQSSDGSMRPGHNGPYNDIETPLRNTAHWIITFHFMYKVTKNDLYINALQKCADFLISKNSRPMNNTFFCRKNPNKDFSNGLIGQAWIIEALVEAYKATNTQKYIDVALEIFMLHPFDENKGLWKVVNVDGSYNGFDMTFNHQLWFASSLVLLYDVTKNDDVLKKVSLYFEKQLSDLKIRKNGLIIHKISFKDSYFEVIKDFMSKSLQLYKKIFKRKSMHYKENGYHVFNLYGLALIKDKGFDLPIFKSKNFRKSLSYAFSSKHLKSLLSDNHSSDITNLKFSFHKVDINRYGFLYNALGFELPFVLQVFSAQNGALNKSINAFNKQIDLTWNETNKQFSVLTEDAITLTARVYELTRVSYEFLRSDI